jgi:hypothetical protein
MKNKSSNTLQLEVENDIIPLENNVALSHELSLHTP